MKSKKKISLFYKIYFSLLILFAVALAAGCIFLALFIKDYNEGISETVSQRFFENNFLNLNAEQLVELSGIKPCEFETDEDIINYITDSFKNSELSYTSVSSVGNDEVKKYIVKSGDYKVATFTLKADENNDFYFDSLDLHLSGNQGKQIQILNTSKLFINGIEVSDEYITETVPHENAVYLPENVPAPMWVTYEITGLTKKPVYKIVDRNGAEPELVDADGTLKEDIIFDTDKENITARLVEAAKEYAKCMQNDAAKQTVLKYFKKGTALYESIRTAENYWTRDHAGYSFTDESVSEFMRYDENTVSCRISFIHLLHKYGSVDFKDFTDITYFAEKINGEYIIYARHNN